MARETLSTRIALLEQASRNRGEQIEEIDKKVDEIRDVLMQARGAKWAIASMVAVGGVVGGIVAKLIPFLNTVPLPR